MRRSIVWIRQTLGGNYSRELAGAQADYQCHIDELRPDHGKRTHQLPSGLLSGDECKVANGLFLCERSKMVMHCSRRLRCLPTGPSSRRGADDRILSSALIHSSQCRPRKSMACHTRKLKRCPVISRTLHWLFGDGRGTRNSGGSSSQDFRPANKIRQKRCGLTRVPATWQVSDIGPVRALGKCGSRTIFSW
jgi:hypothetical protein